MKILIQAASKKTKRSRKVPSKKIKRNKMCKKITFNYDIFDGVPAPKRSHAVLGNRRLRLNWLKITTNDLHALEGFHAQRMIWSC